MIRFHLTIMSSSASWVPLPFSHLEFWFCIAHVFFLIQFHPTIISTSASWVPPLPYGVYPSTIAHFISKKTFYGLWFDFIIRPSYVHLCLMSPTPSPLEYLSITFGFVHILPAYTNLKVAILKSLIACWPSLCPSYNYNGSSLYCYSSWKGIFLLLKSFNRGLGMF